MKTEVLIAALGAGALMPGAAQARLSGDHPVHSASPARLPISSVGEDTGVTPPEQTQPAADANGGSADHSGGPATLPVSSVGDTPAGHPAAGDDTPAPDPIIMPYPPGPVGSVGGSPVSVPEPTTTALLGTGLALLALRRARRRSA